MHKSLRYSTISLLLFFTVFASSAFSAEPAPTYTDPTTGMHFVYIPGGTFVMGDPTGQDPFAKPAHEVTVKPFYLGKYEVTFKEYDQFCEKTGRALPDDSGFGRDLHPVINVSWDDAVAFTEWLSKKTDKKLRLPSEAEWEFAGRGGTTTFYYWGNELGRSNANCKGCGGLADGKGTVAIGSFKPNPYGLYDMTGNVYEWCLDTRHRSYEGAPVDGSAWLVDGQKDHIKREFRMNRGGSWFQPVREMTIFRRCWDAEEDKRHELGFRVLMEP